MRYPVDVYFDFGNDLASLNGGIDIYMSQADHGRLVAIAACLPLIDEIAISADGKEDLLTEMTYNVYNHLKLHIMTSEIYWELTCNDQGMSMYEYAMQMPDIHEYLGSLSNDLAITEVKIDPMTRRLVMDYKMELIEWIVDRFDKAATIVNSHHKTPDSLIQFLEKKGLEVPKEDLDRFFNEDE